MSQCLTHRYALQSSVLTLQKNLACFSSTEDPLLFYMMINESIHMLQHLSNFVRSKRNTFGLKLPVVIICNIFCFLPTSNSYLARTICKSWFQALTLPFCKKIQMSRRPMGAFYVHSWKTKSAPRSVALSGKRLLVSELDSPTMEIYNLKGDLLAEVDMGKEIYRSAATNKYICQHQMTNVRLLTSENQFLREWPVPECRGIAIQDEHVYISSSSTLSVYSVKGFLVRSWKLKDSKEMSHNARKLALYEKQIFMVDTAHSCVTVFSRDDGTLLREWGKFKQPWGIAVSSVAVYVVDSGNNCIQAFTHEGQFLFEILYPNGEDLAEIFTLDDKLYVSDWKGKVILVFQLIYG
jgi:hypothetical protein